MHYIFPFQAAPRPCPAHSPWRSLHARRTGAGPSAPVSGPTLERVCVAAACVSKLIVPVSAISMARHRTVLFWQQVGLQQHLRWQRSSPTQNFPSTVSSVLEDCIKYWESVPGNDGSHEEFKYFPEFSVLAHILSSLASFAFCQQTQTLSHVFFFKVLQNP